MKVIKAILIGLSIIVGIPLVAVFSFFYFNGSHTPYCPLDHRMSDLSACFVKDELAGRILIQHGDLDFNWYYLEVLNDGHSQIYEFPDSIHVVGPDDYTAELIPGVTDHVLIDGERFQLQAEEQPYERIEP